MAKKSVIEKADETIGTINDEFDLTIPELREIQGTYGGSIDTICTSFRYGYAQGTKAAEAQRESYAMNRKPGDLIAELVHVLALMSVEELEEFRTTWIDEVAKSDKTARLVGFCNTAVDLVIEKKLEKRELEVAISQQEAAV